MNNNWLNLKNDFILKRFYESKRSPAYTFYFIFIIVALGSLGLWADLKGIHIKICGEYDENKVKSIISNLSGISLTLIASCVVEFLFIKRVNIEDKVRKIDVQSFGLVSLVSIFLAYMFANNNANTWGLFVAVISILYTWWFWWIANAKNKVLGVPLKNQDEKHLLGQPTGKNENEEKFIGNLEGFTNE
ncbi:hypothetical protein [Sphingobacterium faecium]